MWVLYCICMYSLNHHVLTTEYNNAMHLHHQLLTKPAGTQFILWWKPSPGNYTLSYQLWLANTWGIRGQTSLSMRLLHLLFCWVAVFHIRTPDEENRLSSGVRHFKMSRSMVDMSLEIWSCWNRAWGQANGKHARRTGISAFDERYQRFGHKQLEVMLHQHIHVIGKA